MQQYVNSYYIGHMVSFQSKSTKDATTWRGKVDGIVSYNIARQYGDVISYNAAVQNSDPDVPNVEDLTYFVFALDNGEGDVQLRVFANEWILDSSFHILDEKVPIRVTVYDAPENDHANIITVLKAAGYTAVLSA